MSLELAILRLRSRGERLKYLSRKLPFTPRGAVLTRAARDFMVENADSPVVHAAGREDGGAFFVLANMRRFELSAKDVAAMPMPNWGETD